MQKEKKKLNRDRRRRVAARLGQRLEMFSFFHSMKSLKPASDLQLNQSHHYEIRCCFFWGGALHGDVGNKDVLKTQTRGVCACVCVHARARARAGGGGDASKKGS